jgi:hypothetical protein
MRDQKTENHLNTGNYNWQYHGGDRGALRRVQMTEIDMQLSRDNPARLLRRLNQDRACDYGVMMEAGIEFPAVVLLNHPAPHDGMAWIVATGMHRLEGGLLAHRAEWDAYCVIEADDYRRDHLIRSLNRLEGEGDPMHVVLAHILHEHETFGKPLTELAKSWHVKLPWLQNGATERRARLRARRLNYDVDRARIPATIMVALGSLQSDVIFEKAMETVATTPGVTTGSVRDMVSDVKKGRSEAAQLEAVRKFTDQEQARVRAQRAQHGRATSVAIDRVMSDVRRLNNALSRPFEQLHVAALENKPDKLLLVDALLEKLKLLRAEIERREAMSKMPDGGTPGEAAA